MRLGKRAMAAAMIAVFCLGGLARADAVKQMPANALVVYRVGNLELTSKKVADFCGSLGLVQMNPELADPLGMLLKKSGITAGLNKSGDFAMALIDPGPGAPGRWANSMLMLFPVSDYQAYIGNFPGAATTGEVTEFRFKDDPTAMFMAHWGDYAAVSPVRDLVATKPTAFLMVGGLAAKEMEAKDFVIFANVKALRAKVLPAIAVARIKIMQGIDRQAQSGQKMGTLDLPKVAPVVKVVVNQVLDLTQEFINDVDDATLGTNLSPEGIGSTLIVEFQPASKFGTLVASAKNTEASLLSGLPDGKYLVFGGATANPQQAAQFLNDFLNPIEKSITDLGPQFAPFNDEIEAIKTIAATQTGGRFALLAPSGMLGQEPLLQMIAIRSGDAKTLLAAQHKAVDSWQAAMASLGIVHSGTTTTITPAAKTLDGVTFDLVQTTIDMTGQNFQQQQAMQFLQFLYGPNGMQQFIGPVNDNTLLMVAGLSDPTISTAIAAARSNDDPLAKTATLKTVAAQLPARRTSVIYLPLDVWAMTGLNYAKQFSMDMGVKIPEDLPPVGITFSNDGSALRVDGYAPSQLVQALTSAGMQLYMAAHQPPGGPGAPGGPGEPGGPGAPAPGEPGAPPGGGL